MSLLIKGGEVLDGSGAAPKKSDVLVVGGRIAAMGDLATYKADKIVQAAGDYVLPGFVDVSSVSDSRLSLFEEPRQADYLKQGVTTVVCGTNGKSLAPAMYAGEISSSNAGWQTMGEYLGAMESLRLGVNFATFSGYESLRRSITYKSRNLGSKEISVLSHVFGSHLEDGSAGISLGDGGFSEFDASKEEIEMLIGILAGANKAAFVSFKAEDKPYASFAEAGAATIVGRLNESVKNVQAFEKLVSSVEKKALKAEFAFAFNPYPYFEFKASEALPASAGKPSSIIEALGKKRIFGFFSKKVKEFNPEETFIWDTPKKEARFLLGKTVAEFAENRGVDAEEAFARIIGMCGPEAVFLSRMQDSSIVDAIASHPKSIIAGSVWSPMSGISHIHSELSDPFTEFIRVADRIGLRPELVAKKLSGAARLLGFKKRGLVKEGFAADLVVLKNKRPEITLVNGEVAYESGSVSDSRSGEVISG